MEFKAKHKKNLIQLANYLLTLPEDYQHFDMMKFCRVSHLGRVSFPDPYNVNKTTYNECGTVACAVGHAPAAGLDCSGFGNWFTVSEELFGLDVDVDEEWLWCFSDDWVDVDNTPQGAGKRILLMLEKGLPDDWEQQIKGAAALTY